MALTKEPLGLTGVLNAFQSFDVTPTIGTEFPDASLKAWLEDSNADSLFRDLAITGQPQDLAPLLGCQWLRRLIANGDVSLTSRRRLLSSTRRAH
jgi:hypothetical protein